MKQYVYKVHESAVGLVLGIILFIIAVGVFIVGFFVSPENGQAVCFWMAAVMAVFGGLLLLDYFRRGLLVVVEGREYIYRPFIGPSKHFYRHDVGRTEIRPVKFSPQDECIIVYDREGKRLAGLELNMINSSRFIQEIVSGDNYADSANVEYKEVSKSYFKELETSSVENLSENEKKLRRQKVAKIQRFNYGIGIAILFIAVISLTIDKKLFCILISLSIIATWAYLIAMRDYLVFEYNKIADYDKTLYASSFVPVMATCAASILGPVMIFMGINYTNYVFIVVRILLFGLLLLALYIIVPKENNYKIFFYILVFIIGCINGWMLSGSITYCTGKVTDTEEIEIVDNRISESSKGSDFYYVTINSDSFDEEEIEVSKEVYRKAIGRSSKKLQLYFAKDILGAEYYYIE